MSTSRKPESGAVVEPFLVERAEHLGDEFDHAITACKTTIRDTPELSHVAHYSCGTFDFSVDRLGRPPDPPGALPGGERDDLRRLGRALTSTVSRLDRNLQEARTGGLLRIVLHTDHGAAFCNTVVPKQNVVGVVLNRPTGSAPLPKVASVRTADQAMAGLATELRKSVSLGPTNPGGWRTATAPAEPVTEPATEPFVSFPATPDEQDAPVFKACEQAVRPADLHLVAYCPEGEVAYVADQFEHRSLGRFFTQISAMTRRKFYQELSREAGALVTALRRTIRGVLGERVVRLALDVEQGAIYYYRLRGRTYLVGVTVDQSRVSNADDRLAELVRAVQQLKKM